MYSRIQGDNSQNAYSSSSQGGYTSSANRQQTSGYGSSAGSVGQQHVSYSKVGYTPVLFQSSGHHHHHHDNHHHDDCAPCCNIL